MAHSQAGFGVGSDSAPQVVEVVVKEPEDATQRQTKMQLWLTSLAAHGYYSTLSPRSW